jgi:hypothetical protein
MNRDQIRAALPILQAFAEGKTVQVNCGGTWLDEDELLDLNWVSEPQNMRIKPESLIYEPLRMPI